MGLLIAALAGAGPASAQMRPAAQQAQWGASPMGARGQPAPVILAQADPRLVSLEEQVRQLNGRLEELNFQILQMQDQMRRMQEDTEFRFQELEGNGGGASAPDGNGGSGQRSQNELPSEPLGEDTATASVPVAPPAASAPAATAESGLPGVETIQRGEPPRTLGTITFDENGNVVSDSGGGQPIDLLQGTQAGSDQGTAVAALPPSDNPDEIYQNAYQFILSGDYRTAEAGFRQYLDRFPEGAHAADANFWLGEALLGQNRYREAAEIFLQANRAYPEAGKAPEMLLKLGVSLAALEQRDVACATYSEIGQRYPNASSALMQRVTEEQALAGC